MKSQKEASVHEPCSAFNLRRTGIGNAWRSWRQEQIAFGRWRLLELRNYTLAVAIAALPARIRGFGHVKLRNAKRVKTREAELLGFPRSKVATASAA